MAYPAGYTRKSLHSRVMQLAEKLYGDGDGIGAGIGPSGGTAADPIELGTTAKNWMDYRTRSTHTSGDSRGVYLKHYLGGVGGAGEAARFVTNVQAAVGTAHGVHNALEYAAAGTTTGQGIVSRNTFHVPGRALTAGTYAAVQAEIYADESGTVAGTTVLALFRAVLDGNATAVGLVDHGACLMSIEGNSIDTGHIIAAKASAAVSHVARIKVNGVLYYIMLSNQI